MPRRAADVDGRVPCIIGVAQETWRPDAGDAPEPLELWAEVADTAARDAGTRRALDGIDALHAVHCLSWDYDDSARRLAERLEVTPTHMEVSMLAGTASQRMVNAAAERMLRGESDLALVAGGEALATRRRMRARGEEPRWSHPAPATGRPPIDLEGWISPTEWAHDVVAATLTFAALDTARRAHLGIDPAEYHMQEGRLLARWTEVAAANPYAWFPTARTAEDLITVTPENRIISSPYTKRMVAMMDVDMAAAIIVATHDRADALGVPQDRRVYLRGWAFGRDATHVAERAHLHRSPAMAAASSAALASAGIGIDDVAHLDLYSCFASASLFAADALRVSPDDPRGLTVAGGLPYHGGPASNYTAHSIAGVVDRIRDAGEGFGLVSGVGMHMTKHVCTVYGAAPGPVSPPDETEIQADIDRDPARPVVASVRQAVDATIAAYSVTHDRSGAPATALINAELADGSRAYARTTSTGALDALGTGEWVGLPVCLTPGPEGTNIARL